MKSQPNSASRKPEQVQPNSIDPEELLTAEETAKLLRLEVQTLASWRSKKLGPSYAKVGRSIFYQRSAISAWLATTVVTPSTGTAA